MDTLRHGLVNLVAAAVAAAVLLTLLVAAPVRADVGLEAAFADRVNLARQQHGLHLLRKADDLVAVARRHSQEMAATGSLHHNAELGTDVAGWQVVAENVGHGASVELVHSEFMASVAHRSNILRANVSQIGVGVVVADGQIWVTQVFRQPAGTAAPTTAAPSTAPSPDRSRPVVAAATVAPARVMSATRASHALPIVPADGSRVVPAPTPVEVGSLLADVLARTADA